MKNFLFFLFLPIVCVLIIVFGVPVVGFIIAGVIVLYIIELISAKRKAPRVEPPFVPHKKSQLPLGGYLYYFQPSLVTSFDEYFLERLEIDDRRVFIAKQNPLFTGINDDPYFEELDNNLRWELKRSLRKFKYIQVQMDNILKKLNEFDRRRLEGNPVKKRSELNMSNFDEGFGHIQINKSKFRTTNKVSLRHRFFYIILSLGILGFICTLIYRYI